MKHLRKRLTYANVVSSIALFLVLGGATALAAGLAKNSVGSKQIKKNAVTSAKIKNNAVTTAKIKNGAITGAKVNVGSLGTVPNAAHANNADSAGSAGNAGNANTVAGIGAAEINYNADDVAPLSVIYERAGLTLLAECGGADNIDVIARTSTEHASIYSSAVDTDSDELFTGDSESGSFEPGEDFSLLQGLDGDPGLITFEYDTNGGTTVTGTFSVDEDNSFGPECQAHGVVFNS